jgi:hypothetical protein
MGQTEQPLSALTVGQSCKDAHMTTAPLCGATLAALSFGGRQYRYDRFGTLEQTDAQAYDYTPSYCQAQKTTTRLSHLRLGFFLGLVPFERLRDGHHLELGPGGGQFMTALRDVGVRIDGHDVVVTPFSTVTHAEVHARAWDVLFLYDVLEHFVDIDELWQIDFSTACISFPERPPDHLLADWRHLKPDEHRWHFTRDSFSRWATAHGATVQAVSTVEDAVRTRWHPDHPNICTAVITRPRRERPQS